jgi:hypothetical protein
MNTKLFYTTQEFAAWKVDQFPDSPEMRRQVLFVPGDVAFPAVLVFQWLVKRTEGGGADVYELLHQWVTLPDFNETNEYKTVIVERQGSQRRETILLPPKLKAPKEPEKITVIRAFTLE